MVTLGDFAKRARAILFGDVSVLSDDDKVVEMIPLVSSAISDVIKIANDITLYEFDAEGFTPLRYITPKYFIRKPITPTAIDSSLDIDDRLLDAVCYMFASYVAKDTQELSRKSIFAKDGKARASEYNCTNYSILAVSGKFRPHETGSDTAIEYLLDYYGYRKFYDIKRTISGNTYIWNDAFVQKLDSYLAGNEMPLTKSEMTQIKLFLDYEDGILSGDGTAANIVWESLDNLFLQTSIGA